MNTLIISTASSLTVASTAIRDAKHGNRKISSLAGSSDTLKELGVNTQMNPEVAQKSLEQFNFCFMYGFCVVNRKFVVERYSPILVLFVVPSM